MKEIMDKAIITQIAKLSRLEVEDRAAEAFSEQFTKIMEYFDQISKINTQGVEPLVTPTEIENYWREDKVEKVYSGEEMLQNAPSRQGNLFKVPPVV